jgi:3-oxoadipate CoA-transferase alpha subunit
MCTAATTTIVQARRVVPLGDIPPEQVMTPGIFVDRIVEVPNPGSERAMIHEGIRYKAGDSA